MSLWYEELATDIHATFKAKGQILPSVINVWKLY